MVSMIEPMARVYQTEAPTGRAGVSQKLVLINVRGEIYGFAQCVRDGVYLPADDDKLDDLYDYFLAREVRPRALGFSQGENVSKLVERTREFLETGENHLPAEITHYLTEILGS